MDETKTETIDQYIALYPVKTQELLIAVRKTIQKTAPLATEKIGYGMPTFVFHGNLVHFAAYKNHIGFYPTPSGIVAFQDKLIKYVTSKGAIQFPIDAPLPLDLIAEITQFRVNEVLEKLASKKK
jgi:uncharacterized protein YdhG (YjbR/CyaY superfamily)